jgi:hypothetical protein
MKTAIVVLVILAGTTSAFARVTCSQQERGCFIYSARYRPYYQRNACIALYRICLHTGIWDGQDVFPFGGAFRRGMIRR